jgi:hypothetical protein
MILRKKKKNFEQPKEGTHLAVLADVQDLGEKLTPWGKQQVRFRWFVKQVGKDGKQLSVIATYNNSIDENANLFQAITDITGKPPDDGFDTENMIGINNRLDIKHHKTLAGNIFPKIVAYLPPAKDDPVLPIPAWYRRGTEGNHAPAAAAPRAPANTKPVVSAPLAKRIDNPELPPEPHDLDTGDDGTSFPGDDATSDENAA